MSNENNGTTEVPSRISIAVMASVTAVAGGATFWIIGDDQFDGRHLVGFLLGLVATVVLGAQTIGRMIDRARARTAAELERQREHQRVSAELHANIGTWENEADGAEAYIAWRPDRRVYALGGSLPEGFQPGSVGREDAHSAGLAMESAGWKGSDDEGTRSIRERLMLPGWQAD
jgi:hypothetical protein